MNEDDENLEPEQEEQSLKQLLDPKYELDQIYKKKLRGVTRPFQPQRVINAEIMLGKS